MSSTYQPKKKQLANVRVVSTTTYAQNRSRFKFVGSIWRGLSNFITTKRNSKTGKCSYIDDTSSLTKKTKGDVVRFFSDKQNATKRALYLVVPTQPPAAASSQGKAPKGKSTKRKP